MLLEREEKTMVVLSGGSRGDAGMHPHRLDAVIYIDIYWRTGVTTVVSV
jgi:hypothetical protein